MAQGFVGNKIDYTAIPDSEDITIINDWELILFVSGIPESVFGHKIILRASGIVKQSGA